jgi:enoyl-CoA hydratase/carnithine racemase
VNRLSDPSTLREEAQELAQRLAERAPLAVAATKRAVSRGLDRPLDEGLEAELVEFDAAFRSEDAAEGIAAFLAKRAPTWSGR